jgi:hypothetical protein
MANGTAPRQPTSHAAQRRRALPSIREVPLTQSVESARAHRWRITSQLSLAQLAALTGYSSRAIRYFEAGCTSRGRKIPPAVWRRYKLACLGVQHGGQQWDWGCR